MPQVLLFFFYLLTIIDIFVLHILRQSYTSNYSEIQTYVNNDNDDVVVENSNCYKFHKCKSFIISLEKRILVRYEKLKERLCFNGVCDTEITKLDRGGIIFVGTLRRRH